MSYSTLDELKASPEYQAAGVLERQRLVWENFPALEANWKAKSAEYLESVAYPEENDL